MGFPTVRDCLRLRGFERDLLHDFDRRLREEIVRTGLKASNFDIDAGEFDRACVTVMMTVAADLALASSNSPAETNASHFARVATDALAWAKSRLAGRQKNSEGRGLRTSQSSFFGRTFRKGKDSLQ
jgi:hypothetical protein